MNDNDTPTEVPSATWLALRKPLLALVGFAIFDFAVSLTIDATRSHPSNRVSDLAMFAIASSQLTLLAQWLALADTRWSGRLLFVTTGLGLLALIVGRLAMFRELLPTLFLIFVPQAASLFLARWGGWRIRGDVVQPERRLAPWQFSLWQIIATITALSILFGMARLFHRSRLIDPEAILFLAVNLSLTICSLWAGMGSANAALRISLAILLGNLLCIGLIVVIALVSKNITLIGINWWAIAVIVNLQLLLIIGPLLVLRYFGYRFVRNAQMRTDASIIAD